MVRKRAKRNRLHRSSRLKSSRIKNKKGKYKNTTTNYGKPAFPDFGSGNTQEEAFTSQTYSNNKNTKVAYSDELRLLQAYFNEMSNEHGIAEGTAVLRLGGRHPERGTMRLCRRRRAASAPVAGGTGWALGPRRPHRDCAGMLRVSAHPGGTGSGRLE